MATAASLLTPAPPLPLRRPPPPSNPLRRPSPITCGPRDNRGPLLRGRTLSTQAILAIQALKRAAGDDAKSNQIISQSFSRLLKSDLLAALAELQRQDHWRLARRVFSAARKEPWYKTDYALYAQMVAALSRSGAAAEIDALMAELMEEGVSGVSPEDVRGITRLVRALLAADRGRDAAGVYGMMKRGGCVPDEYLFRVLVRGLRRLGEEEAAVEAEKDFEAWRGADAMAEMLSV